MRNIPAAHHPEPDVRRVLPLMTDRRERIIDPRGPVHERDGTERRLARGPGVERDADVLRAGSFVHRPQLHPEIVRARRSKSGSPRGTSCRFGAAADSRAPVTVAGSKLSIARARMRPPARSWLAINIPQLRKPNWSAPRGPPWWLNCPQGDAVGHQVPRVRHPVPDGIGTASGIQVVPDPILSTEMPSGSGTIPCFMAVSNIRGMPGISAGAVHARDAVAQCFGGMLGL